MTEERLVNPNQTAGGDDGLRPGRLDDFIGQGQGLGNLTTFIQAARGRGDAMDHTLLHGPPGLGRRH